MRVKQLDTRGGSEIVSWRRRQLVHAGFGRALAAEVAGNSAYDLHALIELVERGCPPALAVRILAPLEQGWGV